MEIMQNVYHEPEVPVVPTIRQVLEEDVDVTLTREQVLWLRKRLGKRMEQVRAGMMNPQSKPAKRSMRMEEYRFLRHLQDRLLGVSTGFDENVREVAGELEQVAAEYERKAEEMRRMQRDIMAVR